MPEFVNVRRSPTEADGLKASAEANRRPMSSADGGDQLRAAQAPLKGRYRQEPAAALVTLSAKGEVGGEGEEGVSCSVQTGRALIEAGLHPATGGTGSLACSGDMLLQALVACAGVTLQAVATNRGIPMAGATVHAEGDLDFRGTLGLDGSVPVGFSEIRLSFDLDSDADPGDLDALIATTERYCVVFQTLAHAPELSVARRPPTIPARIHP